MAVIAVTATDTGQIGSRWAVEPDPVLKKTPIPRGIRNYGSTIAVAALGAGDETNVDITLTFPTAFAYLPKTISIQFGSDDLTTEFSNLGLLEYRPGASANLGTVGMYELFCDGPAFRAALQSFQVYRPQGQWRNWLFGNRLDTIHLLLADISGDTSTAGDIGWTAEFWEYDIEQCLNWPVNTPLPQVAY